MASHQPAHPINEDVEFSATATGRVDKVELWITEFNITPDGTLNATGPATKIKSCDPFAWRSTLTCNVRKPLTTDHTLIEYEAQAFAFGGSAVSEIYRFASGQYHRTTQGQLPTEKDPIPVRVNSHTTRGYLDVVMIHSPDPAASDVGSIANFQMELANVIDLFFKYQAIRKGRGLYNFYYSSMTGKYEEVCIFHPPDNMAILENTADVVVFLHGAEMTDCRNGTMFSSEHWYDKTLVHEAGHGFFDVRDERPISFNPDYYVDLGDQGCTRNIWLDVFSDPDGKSACEAEAPGLNLDRSSCKLLDPPGGVYKIDPDDAPNQVGCIMGSLQHQDFSDYGPACLRRIDWRYEKCLDGVCMAGCP